jgi:putative flippase GtrA
MVAWSELRGLIMLKIALIVWMIGGTTLAGIAIMVVLNVPALAVKDMQYIPIAAVIGFVVAIPIAYVVAKRITALTAS